MCLYNNVQLLSLVGVFMHRFTVPGTYYYWSGWIEPYKTTHFRGSVHVSSESSYSGEVSVKVGDVEALYDVNSGKYTRI